MRGLRLVVAAVALLGMTGCEASSQDSPADASRTSPSGQGVTGRDSMSGAISLVLASSEGVDLMSGSGDHARLSHRPAAVAFGVRDDLVVFQGSLGAGDVYPPSPDGPVAVWSDGSVRELPLSSGAGGARLLDAGLIVGRPVVLVAEGFNEGRPDSAAEALVLIDLADLARLTVVPPQPAWESGHQAAHLRPDGDIVGLYHRGVQVHLIRWSSDGNRVWDVKVAEDQVVSLAAADEVAVVQLSFDERRGFAPVLTVTRYDPATGTPRDPQVIDVADPEGVIDGGIFCRDWLTASELVCARSGDTPIAVSMDSSFYELAGPAGAIPSVVRGP